MSALIFVRDGRTLPYLPVTIAALQAIRQTCERPRGEDKRRSFPHALATYIALLELANEDRSDRAAVSQKDIGERAGCSRSTIQGAVADLVVAGVLEVHERHHGLTRVENEYVVIAPAATSETDCTPARQKSDPRPSEKQHAGARPSPPSEARAIDAQEEQLEPRMRADLSLVQASPAEPKPVRFNGHDVHPTVVVVAEQLLAAFNDATSRDIGSRKTNGTPSPALTQIIGALLDRPTVTLDKWRDAVRFTAANPPEWVKGPLQVGHVFGERAADWALAAQNGRAGDSPAVARGDAIIAEMLAEQRRTQ